MPARSASGPGGSKVPTAAELVASLDLSPLVRRRERRLLRTIQERAEERVVRFRPMSVEERLRAFQAIGYRPHGLFLPTDPVLADEVRRRLEEIGAVELEDERLSRYRELQDETERWQAQGVAGEWTGQQAVARSPARFRILGWGRRSGKTYHASREAVAFAWARPRSSVWIAGPSMRAVERCFSMVVRLVEDLGLAVATRRDTREERLLILENGSRFEGVSLEKESIIAGAAVDLVIVDEAAYVDEQAWTRDVLPPLADRNGQALVLSSYEGDENFFARQAEMARSGQAGEWAYFHARSWENFFAFPQGRRSRTILLFERSMSARDFLEQFGAVPQSRGKRIYPQYKRPVHEGDYPYQPGHPVVLAVDPSGGAAEYAVVAIQDYGDRAFVIDEYYEQGVVVEDIVPVLNRRPWREAVTEMIVDSAWASEIERWNRHGFPSYPVSQKPQPEASFPIVRALLRDPFLFHAFYREKVAEVMAERGLEAGSYDDLGEAEQARLALEVEERLADTNLSPEDILRLRDCARLFVNRTCVNTSWEFLHYIQRRQLVVRELRDTPERPRKYRDHIMDAIRYWAWEKKRFSLEADAVRPRSYLSSAPVSTEAARALAEAPVPRPPRRVSFLQLLRERYELPATAQRNVLRPAR